MCMFQLEFHKTIMRYKYHLTLMLIVLIILVFQEVTIHRNSSVNNLNTNKDRVILNQKMSLVQFKRRTAALKREVDMIAGQTDLIDDNKMESASRKYVKESNTIVYNRIDKAGSTTLIKTLEKMSYRNSFYLVGHGNPNLRYFDSIQKRELAKVFCGRRGDIIYTRHLYYTNFTEFGCNMRDPVSRFISRYTYYREIYEMKKDEPYFGNQGKDRSTNINDCILRNHEECSYNGNLTRMLKFFRMDSQIPYFCGDSKECLILGSRWALEQAKKNIQTNFVMVGILENLSMTHTVLECLLPDQLQGLSKQHEQHHLHVHSHHKDPESISEDAKVALKNRLSLEYELYDFVKERLKLQFEQCKKE